MTPMRHFKGYILFCAGLIIGSTLVFLRNQGSYNSCTDLETEVSRSSNFPCRSDEEKFVDYKRQFASKTLDALLIGRKKATEKSFKEFVIEKSSESSMKTQQTPVPKQVTITQLLQVNIPQVEKVKVSDSSNNNLHQPKFLMSFLFREQLTGAIKHFIYLAGVARVMERKAVVPFAAQSYIIGTPGTINTRESVGAYFDLQSMNKTLVQSNYSSLVSYEEFDKVCQNQLGVLIFFLYRQSPAYYWMTNQIPSIEQKSLESILAKTEKTGYTDCTWMQPLWMKTQKAYSDAVIARKILCVDEQVITSAEQLEMILNQDGIEPCVGVYRWTGVTYAAMKLQFNLDQVVKSEVTHQDFAVSAALRQEAENFIVERLQGNYLAVHARLEYFTMIQKFLRNSTWSNVRQSKEYKFLIESVKDTSVIYRNLKQKHAITKTFLATDLSTYGSTAMIATIRNQEHLDILKEVKMLVMEVFENPVMFNVSDPRTDRGKVAIIESEILSHGSAMLVIGGGKFQKEFAVEKFMRKHNRDLDLVYHGYMEPFWYNTIIGALEKERKARKG